MYLYIYIYIYICIAHIDDMLYIYTLSKFELVLSRKLEKTDKCHQNFLWLIICSAGVLTNNQIALWASQKLGTCGFSTKGLESKID